VSSNCVHSPLKRSSTASCSMCCPKASSGCAISASLHLATANAWPFCANSLSRSTRRTWGREKTHQSQPIQPQSQSCAAQVVASRCFSSAPFNPRGAAHHEPLRFLAPHFFAGCWVSVLQPGFDSPLHKKAPGKSRCCRVFGLRGLAFWRYNLFKRAGKKAILTWQCILNSR